MKYFAAKLVAPASKTTLFFYIRNMKNYISHIFFAKKIKHSMCNDILKVIKKQNWGGLENFGFEK